MPMRYQPQTGTKAYQFKGKTKKRFCVGTANIINFITLMSIKNTIFPVYSVVALSICLLTRSVF